MFIHYLNFTILVYIPTTISLCNHMPRFKNTVRPVVLLEHVGQFLLKLSITNIYAYCISVEYVHYKVLVFCLCRLFGGNNLLIWTTLQYNYNSAIQWGCELLLKLSVTDLYVYCIFVEYLNYKVLIFCLCGSFGRNSLLVLTNLSYNINSAIQGGFQLLPKLYIFDLYAYCIFIKYLCDKVLIFCLCGSFGRNILLFIDNN